MPWSVLDFYFDRDFEVRSVFDQFDRNESRRPRLIDPGDEMVLETAVNGYADLSRAAARFGIRSERPVIAIRILEAVSYEKEQFRLEASAVAVGGITGCCRGPGCNYQPIHQRCCGGKVGGVANRGVLSRAGRARGHPWRIENPRPARDRRFSCSRRPTVSAHANSAPDPTKKGSQLGRDHVSGLEIVW